MANKVIKIHDKQGTAAISPKDFSAWRKRWAAENGQRKPASVGVALETPFGASDERR